MEIKCDAYRCTDCKWWFMIERGIFQGSRKAKFCPFCGSDEHIEKVCTHGKNAVKELLKGTADEGIFDDKT